MSKEKRLLTVKDVAEELGTEAYVLRFYEKELHLEIKRNKNGHRVYTLKDVELFKKIQEMREQGLQLKAIEAIVHEEAALKETMDQIAATEEVTGQMLPMAPKNNTTLEIDISNPNDPKVAQFKGFMTDAVTDAVTHNVTQVLQQVVTNAMLKANEQTKRQIKQEVKEELKQEVNEAVEEKMSEFEAMQKAKDEAYYKKLDEAMREMQKIRKEIGEPQEDEKKSSIFGKLFKGKKSKTHEVTDL